VGKITRKEGEMAERTVETKLGKAFRQGRLRMRTMASDLRTRARSAVNELQGKAEGSSAELLRTLRSKIEEAVSHPKAIQISLQDGRAMVSGQVLAEEAPELISRMSAVRGLHNLDLDLHIHDNPQAAPELQAKPEPPRSRKWSRTRRAAAVLGGGAITTYGLIDATPIGWTVGALGLGLVTRGITNRPLRELAVWRRFRRAVGAAARRIEIPPARQETAPAAPTA
jgi:hypothetical protein